MHVQLIISSLWSSGLPPGRFDMLEIIIGFEGSQLQLIKSISEYDIISSWGGKSFQLALYCNLIYHGLSDVYFLIPPPRCL